MLESKDKPLPTIKAESVIEAVIEAIPAPVFYKHENGQYLGCNHAFEQFVGKPKAELLGKTVYELWEPELAQKYDAADSALLQRGGRQVYETQVTYADGSLRDIVFHKAMFDVTGSFHGLVGVMLDVTDRNKAERKLRHAAETDSLTGLYNRAFFYAQFQAILAEDPSNTARLALLALDLDYFKAANDRYGHLTGDQILQEASRRLKRCTRAQDIVARIGGDEFLILLKDIPCAETAEHVARNILEQISGSAFEISNQAIDIGISIGVLYNLSSNHSADQFLHKADQALYRAKQQRNAVAL